MTEEIDKIFEPTDIEKIHEELKKEFPEVPCNIWGYIKKLEERIAELEKRRV